MYLGCGFLSVCFVWYCCRQVHPILSWSNKSLHKYLVTDINIWPVPSTAAALWTPRFSPICVLTGGLAYQVHVRGNNKGCRLVEFVPRYRVSRFDPDFPDNSVNVCAMTLWPGQLRLCVWPISADHFPDALVRVNLNYMASSVHYHFVVCAGRIT